MKEFKLFLLSVFIFPLFFASCVQDGADSLPEPPRDPHKIPVAQALADLNGLLSEIDGTTRGGGRSVKSVETLAASELTAATRSEAAAEIGDLIHIVNFENNGGYALLGADDRIPSVIAITERGNLSAGEYADMAVNGVKYDETGIPKIFPGIVSNGLKFKDSLIFWGPGGYPPMGDIRITTEAEPWKKTASCATLVQTKWDQGHPYNKECPIENGMRCPAGCVATALGQIIATNAYRFNSYPKTIAERPIDWNFIIGTIPNNQSGKNESMYAPEIACLLRAIGISVNMEYHFDGSKASNQNAVRFLKDIGYKDVQFVDFDFLPVREMLLGKRLPLYIYGAEKNLVKAHAWIADGFLSQERLVRYLNAEGKELSRKMEERHLIHCNFGWYGQADGYYLESVFNPQSGPVLRDDTTDRNGVEQAGGYDWSTLNKMITYIL